MKIDGAILSQGPSDAGPAARKLEEIGYDGGFTFEGPHDPFLPLVAAAEQTEKLELATAIAVAFSRNPMTLATVANDLQLQSSGRFILGLGSQIRPHIEKRFSMPWSKPAARMRELILAIRAIWDCWRTGERLDFRGEFYTHTLMTPLFSPGPNPYGSPRIFLAGVGPKMTEVAGEVADGFFVHPFHTPRFMRETTLPSLERGLEKAGRSREDYEISDLVMVVTGATEAELESARAAVKGQIAFYGSTPAYRGVLECHGRGELQSELNRLSKRGRWTEMAGLVDDELLEEVAVCAAPKEVASRIRERCAGYADRVSLVAPYRTDGTDGTAWAEVVDDLKRAP
jgi:probable F420-dependent oxidoreductase